MKRILRAIALAHATASSLGAEAQTIFFPVQPCRVLDTRDPLGPLGGPALAPGAARIFTVIGTCKIPTLAGAVTVSVNVTATNQQAAGFLQLYAGDGAAPGTSVLTFGPGQTRGDNALVTLSSDGAGTLAIRNMSPGSADVILDINGYFSSGVAGDVVPVSIIATTTNFTHWTFTPNSVTLTLGQSYQITWSTPAAESTVHGTGGLAFLGIANCDAITASSPCVRTFTPSAAQVGTWSYACTNTACGTVAEHNGMIATLTIAP